MVSDLRTLAGKVYSRRGSCWGDPWTLPIAGDARKLAMALEVEKTG